MYRVIGIPWCREEDYDALRAIFEDPENVPATWADFAKHTEQLKHDYEERSAIVEIVDINAERLIEWCAIQGYRVDSRAHHRFADTIARARHPEAGN